MNSPAVSKPSMQPWDAHNQRLLGHVHPPDWINPSPAPRYNLVVIGGGTAGLVSASIAAGLGGKVALIERHLLGGDCLNVGCVPSKALIRAARAAAEARSAGRFGVQTGEVTVDFAAVMERMRRLRADISPHDSAARFRDLGVDVFIGDGRFTGTDTIRVGDKTLRFAKAVIATGARASAPPISGIETVPFLTNESLFNLTELPRRFGIVGAGPIGCEMAQSFARFGSEVFLVETEHGVLPKEDRDAAAVVRKALIRDGVTILGHGKHVRVFPGPDGIRLQAGSTNDGYDVAVDQLLVAAGRAPNVENLGLEAAGIAFDPSGVTVDDRLQTTNPRVYACGDVCSRFQFTHAADFMARMVVQNALFKGRKRAGSLLIPWSTYTSPELAHVGLHEADAKAQGIEVTTYTQEMSKVDRAILDDETEGFVRVHVAKGTDRIVGATIVAAHAGEMISEITLAMNGKIGLGKLGSSIHPYPTQTEAIRKLGDLHSRTRLTPLVKSLFEKWLAWSR
jgi:pyruvate/2-oxoglutarate dehydrogenase complex dihydrolipoamide dehydrogenase (E3) component